MLSPLEIFIVILIGLVICKIMNKTVEGYHIKRGYCPEYRVVQRTFPYRTCEAYGYVVPRNNLKSRPIKIYKCKIGVPTETIKYKIIIDELDRFTKLYEYHNMGPVSGTYLKFDNGKEYKVINSNPTLLL